jgi:hypothetical protein
MKKALIISGIIILLIFAAAGILLMPKSDRKSPDKADQKTDALVPTPVQKPRLTWNDPAGFTFSYDPDITINKHDEDQENYAHLEMTNPEHKGSVIIWEKDTTAADVTAWVRTEKEFAGANVIDTTFGGQSGKKVIISGNNPKIVTGTISDGYLVYAEENGEDSTYWQSEYNSVLNSFSFNPASGNSGSNQSGNDQSGGDDSGSVDDEEVLQ